MERTLRRVRSPPAALWTETLDNLWRINWLLRSFSLWARHPAETSAELNVRLGAAEFFPGASRQVRRVRKRRREGNARAAQGTASGQVGRASCRGSVLISGVAVSLERKGRVM